MQRLAKAFLRPSALQLTRNYCTPAAGSSGDKIRMVRPTNMQKNYLLWSKAFKSAEEIPKEVSYSKLKRATDWARIRINIALCVATVVGCLTFVYAGKKEHQWGNSLEKENLAWHDKVKQKAALKAVK